MELSLTYLETKRLKLRLLTPELNSAVFAQGDKKAIMQFFGITTDEEYQVEKEKFDEGLTSYKKSFLLFHLLEKTTGNVLGWCGYHIWYLKHFRAEIGYIMNSKDSMGKGYMKEAMEEVLRYGFDEMKLQRVEAFIGPFNEPSLKLANHFGFKKEGHLRKHYMKDNVLEDSLLFGLLKEEYVNRGSIVSGQ